MKVPVIIYILCIATIIKNVSSRHAFVMNKYWLCNVKTSCLECLKLSHCSWCEMQGRCFSKKITTSGVYCLNSTIDHRDFGLSVEENSECSCGRGTNQRRCYPEGVSAGEECSGRGNCLCGRCICNTQPFPEYPTKMVMGEYCEFDNYSCDGPECNEGPYSLSPTDEENGSYKSPEVEIPPS